jgi:hypothetical protein
MTKTEAINEIFKDARSIKIRGNLYARLAKIKL